MRGVLQGLLTLAAFPTCLVRGERLDDLSHEDPPVEAEEDGVRVDAVDRGTLNNRFDKLGCYPRADTDPFDEPLFLDKTCVSVDRDSRDTNTPRCRSGLPFYRLPIQEGQSYLDCFRFCLSKGLDLFGLIDAATGEECRCGATILNTARWKKLPPYSLTLPEPPLPMDDPLCKMAVYRYTGGLLNGGVPAAFLALSDTDKTYIHEIATGSTVAKEDGKDFVPEGLSQKLTPALLQGTQNRSEGLCVDTDKQFTDQDGHAIGGCSALSMSACAAKFVESACPLHCGTCVRGQFMDCAPKNCGPGGGPWPKTRNDLVVIPYFLEANIDQVRKETFELATEEYTEKTCVRFHEIKERKRPFLSVGVTDENSCSSSVGYPGDQQEANLNMGWCATANEVGSVIHELGHALGMAHEVSRPDAWQSMISPSGEKGPFLNMYWQNVPHDWLAQYASRPASYIGSRTAGYVPYDFESIMHYGRLDPVYHKYPIYDTRPSSFNSVVGQRRGLSHGDRVQIADFYQCPNGGAPALAPARVSAPPPPLTASQTSPRELVMQCPNTCFDKNCSYWMTEGYSCQKLMETYQCDCSGCGCCPATCQKQTCNFWISQGYTCGQLQNHHHCDCSGCSLCK